MKKPTMPGSQPDPRPVRWIASSKEDLSAFPSEAKLRVGGALWEAQLGKELRLKRAQKDYELWRRDKTSR